MTATSPHESPDFRCALNRRATIVLPLAALATATIWTGLVWIGQLDWGHYTGPGFVVVKTPTTGALVGLALLVAAIGTLCVLTNRRRRPLRLTRRVLLVAIATAAGITTMGASTVPQVIAPPRATATTATVDLAAADRAAVDALMDDYYQQDGGSAGRWLSSWWTTATTLDAVIDYEQTTGDRRYVADIAHTWAVSSAVEGPDFTARYSDDTGWWGLAWLHAYQLTGDHRYLATAQSLDDFVSAFWTSTCGGGVKWATHLVIGGSQKNAISNELYLSLSAELAKVTGQRRYLNRALETWRWLRGSGMVRPNGLIIDHLDDSCRATSVPLSYNQGAILPGLVALTQVTGDPGYQRTARQLATASTTNPRLNPGGILRDLCEPHCSGDGEYKGPYVQGLAVLNRSLSDHPYSGYLVRQAISVWRHDRMQGSLYGQAWAGPPDAASPVRQMAAIDALTAAQR